MRQATLDLFDEVNKLSNKIKLFDIFIPPILFWVFVQYIEFLQSIIIIFLLTLLVGLYRLLKQESLLYVSAGVLGVILTAVSGRFAGESLGVVLPDMITDGVLMLFSLISLFFGIPFVAFTSHIFRRWPKEWYLHDKVKPAYSEATIIWIIFFLTRIILKLAIVDDNTANTIINNILLSWPTTFGLLIFTYVYGIRRLRGLQGPSVDEFKQYRKPPWKGQKKGF